MMDDLRRLMTAQNKSIRDVQKRNSMVCSTVKKPKYQSKDGVESCASEATPVTDNTSGTSTSTSNSNTNDTYTKKYGDLTINLKSIAERSRPRAVATRRAKTFRRRSSVQSDYTMCIECSDSESTVSKSCGFSSKPEQRRSSMPMVTTNTDQWYFQSRPKINNRPATTSNNMSNCSPGRGSVSIEKYKLDKNYYLYSQSRSLSPVEKSKSASSTPNTKASNRRSLLARGHSMMSIQDDTCNESICRESITSYATTGKINNAIKTRDKSGDNSCDQSVKSFRAFDRRRTSLDRPRAIVLRDYNKKHTSPSPPQSFYKDDNGISCLIHSLRSQIISLHLNEGINSPEAYNKCYMMLEQLNKSHSAAMSHLSDQVKHWKFNSQSSQTVSDAFFSSTPPRCVSDDDDTSLNSCNHTVVLA